MSPNQPNGSSPGSPSAPGGSNQSTQPNQPTTQSNQAEVKSQQDYNEAQQGVIDATEDYADAVEDLNTAQNAVIKTTGETAGATSGVLTQINSKFSMGEGVATNPTNDAKGANQHLMIYVPTCKTRINMGHEYPAYKFYNGFCAHTECHVVVSAYAGHPYGQQDDGKTGPKAAGKKTKLTTDNMGVFESKGRSIYCNAYKAALITGANVVLSGRGGVAVAGGFASGLLGQLVVDPLLGDAEPATADMGGQTGTTIKHIANVARIVDGVLAAKIAKSAAQAAKNKSKSSGHVSKIVAVAGALNAVGSGLDAVTGTFGAGGLIGGAVLYGDIAMILGTPAYASIYGALGVRLSAIYCSAVYGADVGALGGFEARMSSPHAVELKAARDTEVVGSSQVLAVARSGPTFIEGEEVLIGRKQDVGTVCFGTTKAGGIDSDNTGNLIGSESCLISSEGSMVVGANEKLGILSEKTVGLGAGAAHFLLKKKGITIRAGGSALPDPPAVPAQPAKAGTVNEVTSKNNGVKSHFESVEGKLAGYGDELATKGSGDAEIFITDKKIQFKFGGKVMKGTSKKWTVDGKAIIVKK